jgi:hypothetical protein
MHTKHLHSYSIIRSVREKERERERERECVCVRVRVRVLDGVAAAERDGGSDCVHI